MQIQKMDQSLGRDIQNKNRANNKGSQSNSPSATSISLSASQAFNICKINEEKVFQIQEEMAQKDLDQNDQLSEKKLWSISQQDLLLKLHDQLGNKWTDIASNFDGRDHNCVKNHFYAQIRKSLRRLNYFSKKYFHNQLKQLNMNHVSKMITMLSQRRPECQISQEKLQLTKKLKRFLFQTSKKQQEQQLSNSNKTEMKENINCLFQLLQEVKKINLSGKKLKNKKQIKNDKNKGSFQKTFKMTMKEEKNKQVKPNQVCKIEENKPQTTQFYSPNLMFVYLPWNFSEPNNGFLNPNYGYSWPNDNQQKYIIMDGNIFTSS